MLTLEEIKTRSIDLKKRLEVIFEKVSKLAPSNPNALNAKSDLEIYFKILSDYDEDGELMIDKCNQEQLEDISTNELDFLETIVVQFEVLLGGI